MASATTRPKRGPGRPAKSPAQETGERIGAQVATPKTTKYPGMPRATTFGRVSRMFERAATEPRVQILWALREGGQSSAQLCAGLEMKAAILSGHLTELKAANLIETQGAGGAKTACFTPLGRALWGFIEPALAT